MASPFTTYKLIILYMLQNSEGDLTNSQITDFILDRKYTNYFQLQQAVSELVEADLSIKKRTVHTDEAIGLFGQYGMYDKEELFRYRRVSKVNLYSINEFEDYYYGYMVPDTGYLKYFKLYPYDEGFVMQMPTRKDPEKLPPFTPSPKIFQVQKEAEKFDTSTPMGRAMLNICIVFAQLERESIQMRVQDAFYSRCTKGYYMRGRTPYGFDTEPIVMDGIKTKKLVENAEMDFAELMYQMYAEPSSSYGDITRYFVKNSIDVYGKALQRAFISKLLRNPVYVQADMDIYEYFKAQGVKIESPPEMFTGDNSCYLYQGREGEEQILVIAPHQGRIPSSLWLTVQRKLSQNTSFQNGRKCHNTWLAGKIKCGRCGYALVGLRAQNGVTYLRCKQRADNGSCEGAGTLTAQSMESFVYGEMVEKMRKYHTLKGGKEPGYNPKLTAARVALAKTESEIEKLLDTLSGANPLLLQYANNRIEELDAERQKQLKLVADLTANSVSDTQIDCITNYLNDWESVSFDDKRKVVDILISHIDATSESVTIHWKI